MKEIKLSQNGTKYKDMFVALVDDEDYEYLNQFNWTIARKKCGYYAHRKSSREKGIQRHTYFMHREIMNTPDNMECDHAFHNGLDNRKFIEVNGILKPNLRNCTHKQNNQNKLSHKDSISKYIGVSYRPDLTHKKRIRARIFYNNKEIYLGDYNTEAEAAKAYDIAAVKYFGEFANLNFK